MAKLIVRIDLGPAGRIGPGKILLLKKIDEFGSISGAARAMNMSYRQAWELVHQINECLKEPAVSSQPGGKSGGGAKITASGGRLLRELEALSAVARESTSTHIMKIEKFIAEPKQKNTAD